MAPLQLIRELSRIASMPPGTMICGTSGLNGAYYVIQSAPYVAFTNTFNEPRPEPVWLYGTWWSPERAAAELKHVLLASWEAVKRIKYHARNLFLEPHQFEIRQPCWGSGRWRSVT